MIYGFILLLALPLVINEFLPDFGNKIVSLFYGPEVTAFAYLTLLAIYCLVWFLKTLADKEKAQKEQKAWLLKNIEKTKLITVNGQGAKSYTTTNGAIGRAIVGSMVAGPVGAVIGASTARTHTTTKDEPSKYMFMVYYKNGSRERDTVTEDNWKFEIYMDYIDLDD